MLKCPVLRFSYYMRNAKVLAKKVLTLLFMNWMLAYHALCPSASMAMHCDHASCRLKNSAADREEGLQIVL